MTTFIIIAIRGLTRSTKKVRKRSCWSRPNPFSRKKLVESGGSVLIHTHMIFFIFSFFLVHLRNRKEVTKWLSDDYLNHLILTWREPLVLQPQPSSSGGGSGCIVLELGLDVEKNWMSHTSSPPVHISTKGISNLVPYNIKKSLCQYVWIARRLSPSMTTIPATKSFPRGWSRPRESTSTTWWLKSRGSYSRSLSRPGMQGKCRSMSSQRERPVMSSGDQSTNGSFAIQPSNPALLVLMIRRTTTKPFGSRRRRWRRCKRRRSPP